MTNDQAVLDQLFAGGGEMGALMRARFACTEGNADCSQTSLGLPEHWSQSLKTARCQNPKSLLDYGLGSIV